MSGPDCELDWHIQSWTAEMADAVCKQLSKADTLLFGRVTYSAMARYWASKAINLTLAREDIVFAEMLNQYDKIIFSKTLKTLPWNNSQLVRGNMADQIRRLKQRPGKDIIIYGSSSVVSALMQSGLVDEYHIWVHPVLLGKGKPLFKALSDTLCLTLLTTKTFSSGVVLLQYAFSGRTKTSNECA